MSDESTVFFPRKLVKQFILKYKELECLWNRDCPSYKIKKRRHQAITQLTQLVQTYDSAATRVHILRKIDSLRACVRREYKKVIDSKQIATCDEQIYVPQLWYYPLFAFLIRQDEHESEKKVKETIKYDAETPDFVAESSDEEPDERSVNSPQLDIKPQPTYQADCIDYELITSDVSKADSPKQHRKRTKPREGSSTMEDEYDAIGINVAAKLRYLPENMRILAEKLIGDVLFQAQTNRLTAASELVTPDPFH